MRLFRDVPIRRKLIIITMATSGAALLLAGLAFVAYEVVVFRESLIDRLSITASIVGHDSSAAVTFGDRASAEQTLRALAADTHIRAAAIYGTDGGLFAAYRSPAAEAAGMPRVEQEGYRFVGDSLMLFHQFEVGGEMAGTVYLESDLEEMRTRLRRYSVIMGLVMALSGLLAYLLSRALQRAISAPISQLAGVVGVVTAGRNYSIRVVKKGADELGRLIDGFNRMLGEIQSRDTALQAARDGLEQRVNERTQELQRQITERVRIEQALRAQEERTRLIVDKAMDGIVSASLDGTVLEWNAQAETIFGWSAAEAMGRTLADLVVPPHSRRAHELGLKRLAPRGSAELVNRRMEMTAMRKDGREIPVEVAVTPIRVGDSYVFSAFVRDITQRKQAEADLANAHRQLMDASRAAGMAEVATGVLHNVGNVLNSANVSVRLLVEYVDGSQASELARIVAVLRTHAQDLGEFVTSHPQGIHLTSYLQALDGQLAAEREVSVKELRSLQGNLEHIKRIVTMQQSYARIAGMREEVRVADLVEESVRLNADALVRDGIEVERDFAQDRVINVDKHKALQILVNIVSNARYACVESGKPHRHILLRIAQGTDCVRIVVSDNGIGIARENLTSIFSHGFTTRAAGHGFGLHSGALAARELGGALSVASEGIGQGATFTLELPVECPVSAAESTDIQS